MARAQKAGGEGRARAEQGNREKGAEGYHKQGEDTQQFGDRIRAKLAFSNMQQQQRTRPGV